MTISWKQEAEDNYWNTLDYLASNFSLEIAMALDEEVTKCLECLASGLIKNKYSKKLNAHKIIIKKHNILVYRIDEENLYVLDFIAARTDHKINH